MTDPTVPAGWYPAPHANNEQRYWDGQKWVDPEPPKKTGVPWWVWVIIGVVVLAIIGGVGAALGGSRASEAAPAASSSETPEQPTPTPTPTPEPEPEPVEPAVPRQEFTGSGDSIVDVNLTEPATVTFSCPACSSNTVLKTNGPDTLLVNVIGPYTGTTLINERENSLTSRFEIETDSDWTLVVDDITTAPMFDGAATGAGDMVFWMTSTFDAAQITNDGQSNFVVLGYGDRSPLIVNEIGGYSGTVAMTGPALVQVESTGNWSITPQ